LTDSNADVSGGFRVLLVDDDEAFLEISKQILQQENNYQIDTATSVDQATQKLKTKTFDVVVSDYEMPQKTGLDLLTHIKKNTPKHTLHTIHWKRKRRHSHKSPKPRS